MFIYIGLTYIPKNKTLKSHMINEDESNKAKGMKDEIIFSPVICERYSRSDITKPLLS